MVKINTAKILKELTQYSSIQDQVLTDALSRVVYSTDASAYRERPLGVVLPKTKQDIAKVIAFADKKHISIIPRGAGTSLAGQVVGSGLVVDLSRYMNKILEINAKECWVRVEPGVVLDSLNNALKPYGLFFAPETSTSNRCTIGGMVGNNSCGSHSLVYGSTRDNLISARVLLSNGEDIELKQLSKEEFYQNAKANTKEAQIYKNVIETYFNPQRQQEIEEAFPSKELRRRNNGYALDELYSYNLAKVFAGSEGTLAFGYEYKLHLLPLPPKNKALVCVHCNTLQEAFSGNLVALQHSPMAVELMDNNILASARRNLMQQKNMFFVQGEPKAILIIEIANDNIETLHQQAQQIIEHFKREGIGYAFPVVEKDDVQKVWALRKAGLGLLTNVPGSKKPVSVIEDTAVAPSQLSAYMEEFAQLLDKYGLNCVYHAHIATGELHLRPILDLKDKKDVELFHTISKEVALLVKKYRGSLSGEHGDGRLRGEYIPLMYGEKVFKLMEEYKLLWDKDNIFNKGKIVFCPPMNTCLRYSNLSKKRNKYINKDIRTYYDFSSQKGLLSAIEQCNGSADCRKGVEFLNTMCPSFRATGDERYTPRARANALREYFSFDTQKNNPFDNKMLYWILDNCLMCKGCKNECPSNVDITKLKSEFLQHYYDANGTPLRILLMNWLTFFEKVGSNVPAVYNWFVTNIFTSSIVKSLMHFAKQRSLPTLNKKTFRKLYSSIKQPQKPKKTIYLFCDEFTNYQDSHIGQCALELFTRLGYSVLLAPIEESGRIAISKGMVKRVARIAKHNIRKLSGLITKETPLVGIEPSCILSFRDEYPSLLSRTKYNEQSKQIIENSFLFDEFLASEIDSGSLTSDMFTTEEKHILLHGHCQQKALIGTQMMEKVLSLPTNYSVEVIPSGCCGMAGSFGYEKKHYQMSKDVFSQVLGPAIEKADKDTIIVAPGTSCREQIAHFSDKKAIHPLQALLQALK